MSKTPLKVTCIITGLSTGGAEMMLLKMLERINRHHFEFNVISLTTKGEIGSQIESLDIPVIALGLRSAFPSPVKFLCLVKTLRVIQPDVVHTWMYHSDFLGGMAARLAGIKNIGWALRNSGSGQRIKCSTRLVMKTCAHLSWMIPRLILSCSEKARATHVAAGYCPDKMLVIPNGFDLNCFRPDATARSSVRSELELQQNTPLVGLIARDDPQKNHAGFLEAARFIHQTLPSVHFLLAGTGIDARNCTLQKKIEQLGLHGRVHLLGRRDDIPRLMSALDVLASSSVGEAFPNVLGEAMACEVPCVVTDVGDSAEIVGKTGRVVPSGDMAGLAHILVEVLKLPLAQRQALGKQARERIQNRYEISNVVKQYEAFYIKLSEQE